jgi:hypothetical protein
MTDLQDKQEEQAGSPGHSFGDIPIQPPEADPQKTRKPVKRRSRSASGRKRTNTGRRPRSTARNKRQRSSNKNPLLLLLLIPVAALLLWFIVLPWLIPHFIQGTLAERLAQQLNRPVAIGQVRFSPLDLQLQLAEIRIGANADHRAADEPVLCTVAAVNGQLQAAALFRRKVVLTDVRIEQMEANLVRYADGSYTTFSSDSSPLIPAWLQVNGLDLSDSSLLLHDQPTRTIHRIKQIKMTLPAAAPGQQAVPTLSAMVNDSPILLQGQPGSGREQKTTLSLQLNDLDLEQYLAYLPALADSLTISSKRADAALEIILQDRPGAGLLINGTLTAADLQLQTKPRQGAAAKDKNSSSGNRFQLAVPALELTMQLNPLQSLYTVTSLTLEKPVLTLPALAEKKDHPLSTAVAALADNRETGFALDRLLINSGRLQIDKQQWQAVQIRLSNFRNAGAAARAETKPAELILAASQGDASMTLQGKLAPDLELSGKLSLRNMNTDLLTPLLPDKEKIRFSRGRLSLDGSLTLDGEKTWKMTATLTDTVLQISDFTLVQQKNLLVSGKQMTGAGCTVRLAGQQLNCKQLTIDQADFTAHSLLFLTGTGRDSDKPFFTTAGLGIKNSTLTLLPVKKSAKKGKTKEKNHLKLTGLTLQLDRTAGTDPEQERTDNLIARAVMGKQGRLTLTGFVPDSGPALLQLTGTDLDLVRLPVLFQNWLALPVRQGKLRFISNLQLADNSFTGSWTVNNFMADNGKGSSIRLQLAAATGVTGRLQPFTAAIKELSLEKPVLQLAETNPKLPTGLFSLVRKQKNIPRLPAMGIDRCTISSGSLTGKKGQAVFSELTGRVAPLQAGKPAFFDLNGKMAGSSFTARGRSSVKESKILDISFKQFPLYRYTRLLAESLAMDGKKAVASWQVSRDTGKNNRVTIRGLVPLAGSDFSLVLALLTDERDSFSLPLLPGSPTPAKVVSKSVVAQLRRLGLQTIVSPMLVLEKFLPSLNLAQNVEFLAGEAVPDFMAGLDGYAALLRKRPHLAIALRGGFDDELDRQYFIRILEEAADSQRELENIRRSQTMNKLLAAEQRQQAILAGEGKPVSMEKMEAIRQRPDLQPLLPEKVQISDNTLPNLAVQRALVIRNYLINKLKIPGNRVVIEEGNTGSAGVALRLTTNW